MLGRLFGGIATSLLFSVFDSWLVSEHGARNYESKWLSSTFATAQAGNSIVAIGSGVVGEWAAGLAPMAPLYASDAADVATGLAEGASIADVETMAAAEGMGDEGFVVMIGGYCTPFDFAAAVLLVGGLAIATLWTENYGKRTPSSSGGGAASDGGSGLLDSLKRSMGVILSDRRVLLIGLASSCFEAAMYSFVFMWTPALSFVDGVTPPFGTIFATMMTCCMGGTRVFSRLLDSGGHTPEGLLKPTFALSALALVIPAFSTDSHANLISCVCARAGVAPTHAPRRAAPPACGPPNEPTKSSARAAHKTN